MRFTLPLVAATGLAVAACSSGGGTAGTPMPPLSTTSNPLSGAANVPSNQESRTQNDGQDGADSRLNALVIYTMSNAPSRNAVEGYAARNGTLQRLAPADTHGRGDPSISGTVQGSIATGDNGRLLFAVDAGSNEISSFRIGPKGLAFAGKVMSNGRQPVSLAVHDDLLYVLNAASSDISGFKIAAGGRLRAIPNSTQPLSGKNVGPAEISFDPSGTELVVTEKTTSKIDTYAVNDDVPSPPMVHPSAGTEPFGFAFADAHTMVVSDAFNGAPGEGAASSYDVTANGLRAISSMIPDHNTAPCWVAITPDGRIAFVSNTGSDTISAYGIGAQGRLALTTGNGVSAVTGKGPADLALAPNGNFLFVSNLKEGTLGIYRVGNGGRLDRLKDSPRLPDNAVGLTVLSTLTALGV